MFIKRQELFCSHVGHRLHDTRRPLNADEVRIGCVPEAEVGAQVVLTAKTAATGNLTQLPEGLAADGCLRTNLGADRRSVRDRADEPEVQPRVAVAIVSIEEVVRALPYKAVGDEQIQEAVIVVIAPNRAAAIAQIVNEAAGSDLSECAVPILV